jgi:hypothetical protein
MSDEAITAEDLEALLPHEVKKVLAEEAEFIASKVKAAQGTWDSTVASALTWLPWVGDVFEENRINTAAATSDVNRTTRVQIVVTKLETGYGAKLTENTIAGIRVLVDNLYNTDINLDDL